MAGSDKKLQGFTAFNSGEYSKDLAGRVDLESFASSTRFTSNMLTQVSGGLKKFYGTNHITEKAVDNFQVKMIPFINDYEPMAFVVYGNTDENTDQGLRVGLIYGDSYKDLDIELPNTVKVDELRWQQMQDRLILCHSSVQPFTIDFYGKDDGGDYLFNTTQVAFKEIPYFPIGTTNDYKGTLHASGVDGTITLSIPSGTAGVLAYFPSILYNNSSYTRQTSYTVVLASADNYSYYQPKVNNSTVKLYRIRSGVSTVLASGTINNSSWTHTYSGMAYIGYHHDFTVKDTITRERVLQVIKGQYPSAYINGSSIVLAGMSDHQNGDEYYIQILVGSATREGGTVTIWGAHTYDSTHYTPVEVTTDTLDAEALIGRKIKFFFNDDTVITPWWQGRTVNVDDYAYSNGHWYRATTQGTCGNIQPSHTSGIRSDGGVNWTYVHSGSNTATVLSVPSSTTMTVHVEKGELPKNTNNDYNNYSWSIWGKDGVHPSEVYMVGNRLGFVCNTKYYGCWNAMSVTDDYFNFDTEEYGEQLDTSAIVGLVGNNEASNINWVLAKNNLYMGGYSGEYYVTSKGSGRHASVYTPTETIIENISNIGGKAVIPLKYKQLNMFVGITGKELYTIAYDYTTDDYSPKSMGYLTQHIMERGIKRMQALNNLDRNIYLLHDTKQVSLFNYAAEQKIMGFTELDFADDVIDFVTTYSRDDVTGYAITKRNAGKITIERLAIKSPTYMFDVIEQGDGETLADFVPVPHFANRTVYIKYGNKQFVKVDLDENGDYSHDPITGTYVPQAAKFWVGLPMVAELHTQPAFGNKVEGHQQQSLSFYMRLNESGSFEYGSSVDFSKYFKYENWNTQQEYESQHRLYTGDIALNIPLGYAEAANQGEGKYPNNSAVGINIKSDTPEPLNILSIQEIYV